MKNKLARQTGAFAIVVIAIVVWATFAPAFASEGGLKVFLNSTITIDEGGRTITLPLFKGAHGGVDVFYIVTESSDRADARARGVSWAPKLANALGTKAVQEVTLVNGVVQFRGTVDFTPERVVRPGPTGFPPAQADPGSVGDADYTPLIRVGGSNVVLNAPQVARSDQRQLHDRIVSVDFSAMTVTLHLTEGRYHGKFILYVSSDSSFSVAAALEAATFAPNLNAAPGEGSNDPKTSARASIIPIVNGQTGVGNPQRQGLSSAVFGEGDPINITFEHPNNRGEIPRYSPLWDVHPAVWTDEAISSGKRVLLEHHDDVVDAMEEGLLTSGGSGTPNPDLGGLRAAGFIVNCPIIALR